MARGSTDLDNYDYDAWLAKNKNGKELRRRSYERRCALHRDHSGYTFGIDHQPVKVNGIQSYKAELKKRGLAIADEARKDPKWSIEENAKREQAKRDRAYGINNSKR